MLPPLFEMDDYTNCIRNGNIYCKIRANLHSSNNDSEVWKYIKKTMEDGTKFQRNVLFRNLCIPKNMANDKRAITTYSESVINEEIKNFNLNTSIDVLPCTNGNNPLSTLDYCVLIIVLLYGCLVAYATFQNSRRPNGEKDIGLLSKLSLQYNWKQRTRTAQNEDGKKLRCIQGLRFYTSIFILLNHTKLNYSLAYLDDPSKFEEMVEHPFVQLLNNMDLFWVHIFFLISSWLLTIQICNIFRTHKEFSLKNAFWLIINRYFRIAVTLVVAILLMSTSWISRTITGPNNFDFEINHRSSCHRNWYTTLLFFNNFYFLQDVCIPTTWYLSVDFQMYIINSLTLYVILKYNLNMKRVFLSLFVLYTSVFGLMIYIHDMDIIFRGMIRNIEYTKLLESNAFYVLYYSTYSVWTTSCIGMVLGAIYFEMSKKPFQRSHIWTHLSTSLFIILPILACLLSQFSQRGIGAALLGPLVKILFATGIGIGILGMSQNPGGTINKIFEWKPVVVLSNFTFCIYVFQMPICFMKPSKTLVTAEYMEVAQDFIMNVIYTLPIGIIITLLVEEPALRLQKYLLPQVSKYNEKNCGKKIK